MKEKRWVRYLCLFALALLIAIPTAGTRQAQAATVKGSCGDNATYTFNKSTGKLTISGSGTVKYTEDWEDIAAGVKEIVIGDQITAIADGAFFIQSGLNVKTVTIGKKCKTIGSYAFQGCAKLTTVNMKNSSVTTIRAAAFMFCTKLKNITFSSKLTRIGNWAFYECTNLKSITLPSSLKKIGTQAFIYTGLTSVTIPKKVTSIGKGAFYGCENLTAIKVASGNTAYSSKSGVLYDKNQTKLIVYPAGKSDTSFKIPGTVTKIVSSAFENASKLRTISIPKSVTSIGSSVFYGCSSLTQIVVTDSNTKYSSKDGVLYNKAKTKLVAYPAGKADTSFTIPSSVKKIAAYAFAGNKKIKTLVIGAKVTEIGNYAFCYCSKLKTVVIGAKVTKIGDGAFGYCSKLKTVTFKGSAPEYGSRIFNDVTATVKYPSSKADSWTSTVKTWIGNGADLTFKSY